MDKGPQLRAARLSTRTAVRKYPREEAIFFMAFHLLSSPEKPVSRKI